MENDDLVWRYTTYIHFIGVKYQVKTFSLGVLGTIM